MKTFYQKHKNKLKIIAMFAMVICVVAVAFSTHVLAGDIAETTIRDVLDYEGIVQGIGNTLVGGANPLEAFALSLVALYFVIEVINKSVSIDKISIEMVVKMLLKLLITRILVQNATQIMWTIHSVIMNATAGLASAGAFNFTGISAANLEILPYDHWLVVAGRTGGGAFTTVHGFIETTREISSKGVVGAVVWAAMAALIATSNIISSALPGTVADYIPYLPMTLSQLYLYKDLILINVVVTWIITGLTRLSILFTLWQRNIELIISAIMAPLAMAAFVSDEFKAATKKFIMTFASLCLQGVIIILICRVMQAVFGRSAATDFGDHVQNFYVMIGARNRPGVSGVFDAVSGGGIFNPIIALINNIAYPIMVAMMVGKSRQMANQVLGS